VPLDIVILAAGQGTRMVSALPKVLHPLAGRPLLQHVLDTAAALAPQRLHVVVGHGAEAVREAFGAAEVEWVVQQPQHGTGHAVQQTLSGLAENGDCLILYGDVPLVRAGTLRDLLAATAGGALALLTAELEDPGGYGRILRSAEGQVTAIVEQRDASPAELAIHEVNTGMMAMPEGLLRRWLSRLENRNAQGEYYLTDIVAMAVADAVPVRAVSATDPLEVSGVNTREQLARLERAFQARRARELMLAGVSLADPARLDVRGSLVHGSDVSIDVNVVFEGYVELGSGVRIGPNCLLRDCRIGDGAAVLANSVIEESALGAGCSVGPFARLRPGTDLAEGARIGNFVETKQARIGAGTKINHLSYVGDAELGADVNIGAGTITCNYDGANKHRTTIGDGAFIGSNTALVAPVTVGREATVAAGSVVTSAVPEGALAVARGKQRNIDGWPRPRRKKD